MRAFCNEWKNLHFYFFVLLFLFSCLDIFGQRFCRKRIPTLKCSPFNFRGKCLRKTLTFCFKNKSLPLKQSPETEHRTQSFIEWWNVVKRGEEKRQLFRTEFFLSKVIKLVSLLFMLRRYHLSSRCICERRAYSTYLFIYFDKE